jgi:hypothetical protein
MARLIVLLTLLVTACSDSTGPAWVGTYDLDTFAGRPLPTLIAGEPELSLLAGEIVLRQDGTYRARTQTSAGDQGDTGTYTIDGFTLRLEGLPAVITDSVITRDVCISGQQGCREVGEARYVRR